MDFNLKVVDCAAATYSPLNSLYTYYLGDSTLQITLPTLDPSECETAYSVMNANG